MSKMPKEDSNAFFNQWWSEKQQDYGYNHIKSVAGLFPRRKYILITLKGKSSSKPTELISIDGKWATFEGGLRVSLIDYGVLPNDNFGDEETEMYNTHNHIEIAESEEQTLTLMQRIVDREQLGVRIIPFTLEEQQELLQDKMLKYISNESGQEPKSLVIGPSREDIEQYLDSIGKGLEGLYKSGKVENPVDPTGEKYISFIEFGEKIG